MAGKNTAGGIRKMQKIPEKIGMTGKKYGRRLHKTDRKKMLREPKNTGMANKKTAGSIRKTQKIPEKNRDDGEKTRRAPAQNKQKKSSGNPKYRYGWKKHGKQHP